MSENNVIKFTPASRIALLEQTNQIQYVAIQQLTRELDFMKQKLKHLEQLLTSLNVDINGPK